MGRSVRRAEVRVCARDRQSQMKYLSKSCIRREQKADENRETDSMMAVGVVWEGSGSERGKRGRRSPRTNRPHA